MSNIYPEFWTVRATNRPAILRPDGTSVTYAQLAQEVADFAAQLKDDPGPIALLCDGSYPQYVAYLGALNAGCPVLLMGADHAPEASNISLKYVFSARDNALQRWGGDGAAWHPDLAVLLSTSGSTGAAKWVRLSFANIAANAGSIAQYLTLSEHDCAPMALPFQYSYGMSIVNSHLAAGASVALLQGSVVDDAFWHSFDTLGCTSFAGVPHSFELMEQAQRRTEHLTHLRYMTQAGGRLDPKRVQHWVQRGRDEGWDFFVMYGQTEAAPRISYLPPDMALETPASIGIPVPGGAIWVADETGAALPDGTQGELCYRGPNTMMGYALGDADLLGGQGPDLLKTGDIARSLPNGAFEIVGRMSRFVKLFGLRISLDEVEKRLTEQGFEGACVARDDQLYVALAGAPASEAQKVHSDLAAWLDIPATSFTIIPVEALPRQSSGKVDLAAVGALVEGMIQQAKAERAATPEPARGFFKTLLPRKTRNVADVFAPHFPKDQILDTSSFNSLGGDSLSYVSVSLELETVLGHLPPDWAQMTIAELQSAAGTVRHMTSIEMPTLIRALSIMLIVAGHFEFFDYGGGGANALFVIAGISFAGFTLPQVLTHHAVRPIVTVGARIAVITFCYTLLNYLATGYGAWPAFVFIGNWISPHSPGSAWFIEVYLQLFLILTLVFSIPQLRQIMARAPFKTSAVGAFALVVLAALSDYAVDTHHLFRRLPHLYAWVFMIGVTIGLAQSVKDRLMVSAIFCCGLWQFAGYGNIFPHLASYFPVAVLVLIWLPSVPVPRLASVPVRAVAGASLMIYLTHFQFAALSERLFGPVAAVSWVCALVGGVVAWRLYEALEIRLRRAGALG